MKTNGSIAALILTLSSAIVRAQPSPQTQPAAPPGAAGDYVSRQEYEKLRREQEEMRQELEALKRERATAPTSQPGPASQATQPGQATEPGQATRPAEPVATEAEMDDVNETIRKIKQDLSLSQPGTSQFVLVGDAAFGFTAQRRVPSTFYAQISPLILWRPADRILIEAAADIGINTDPNGNSSTSFDLTIANASYLVNDYLAIGGGLFVVPFGQYHNHFDPPWINKLPDDPLPYGADNIAPGSEVGVFAKGAIPFGVGNYNAKFTYDLYATNGPDLITTDPAAAGSLNVDDFTDLNNNKAVGGRIGFLPFPDMELGYSVQGSEPNAAGAARAHALLQAIDFNWRPDVAPLSGKLDIQGEYIWSNVSRATYDPDHALGFGPVTFENAREGGYLLLGYRPLYVENAFLRKLEFVTRYDFVNTPLASPGGVHEQRLALGIDYWVSPQAVLKVAYEFDYRKPGPGQDGLFIQFGLRL